MVSGSLLVGCAGSNFSSLMYFCASGFMLAINGEGCKELTYAIMEHLDEVAAREAAAAAAKTPAMPAVQAAEPHHNTETDFNE